MRNRMKRIIAIVLALLLVLGMLPGAALADPPADACSGKDAADRNNGQHFWDAVGKQAASCTEEEGIIWKCVYCGRQYFEKTGDALGHDWTAWWTEKEATCEVAGKQRRVCNRCEREETGTIPALGHRWDSGVVTKPASYTEEGVKTYTCRNDRSHTRTERIPKLEPAPTAASHVHTWGEWKTDTSVPASCVQREKQYHTCKECGDTEFRVAGYGDHDWGKWEVVTPATATEPGLERRACRNDPSHTEEREIPPTGTAAAVPASVKPEGELHLDLHVQGEYHEYEFDEPVYLEITVENRSNVTVNRLNYYDAKTHELIGTQTVSMAPGESTSYSFTRSAYNNNYGCYLIKARAVGFTEEQAETAGYDDAAASETTVKSNVDEATVAFPLFLTLDSWLDPAHAQELYNVGDPVYVVHRVTNTGKITLYNLKIGNASDWREKEIEYPVTLQPGESFEVTVCRTAVDNNEGSYRYQADARAFSRPEAHRASAATNTGSDGPEIVVPLGNGDKKDGPALRADKKVASRPANGQYFTVGETIDWSLTITNTGTETMTHIYAWDQTTGSDQIDVEDLAPGQSTTVVLPSSYVDEDIAATLDCYRNIALAAATDEKGYEHVYMGYAFAPLSPEGAKEHPLDGEKGDTTGSFDPSKLPGGGKPAVGPDGEPILGPDGKPVIIPDGMEIVTGPDGKPIFGPDGKPVFVPVGTEPVLGPDGKPIIGPDGLPVYAPKGTEPLTGADGSPVTVPSDLTVTGTDGTSVVIPAGTPVLKLPGGGYGVLLPDGSIIATDKNGNPIPDENGNLIYIGLPGLHGLDGLDTCCELRLNSVGSAELNYTLHACPDHLEAAQAAEAAAAAGTAEGWKQAADIWREEISEICQLLSDAGDEPAKAAVLYDMTMFDAYLANYEVLNRVADEVTVQKAIAEMLRLRCAELCCAVHTAPERLPDSLLNGYALADDKGGIPGREIGALDGSDAALTERFTAPGARTLSAVKELMGGLKTTAARVNAFVMAQAAWQTGLDRVVNTGYKAADKEGRKAIAGCRKALDLMIAAHKGVLEMLYAEAPDAAEEAAASLYRNALLDAGMAFGVK